MDGKPVEIGGTRLRMLLARLALASGRPVAVESLIEDLWDDEPPAGANAALQGLVSRLRKALGEMGAVELTAGGYRLPVNPQAVDAHRFEELAVRGSRELAAGQDRQAAALLRSALELWRGEALADVREAAFARNAATRLHDLRAAVAEDRFEAELRLGRHAEVLADLGAAAQEHPLRERLAGLRMRALSAAGRQSDALEVYQDIRGRLGDDLGVDPSSDLQQLHLALLRGELERPAARAEATPSRLPARLTSFVGREAELAQVAELLSSARLVTIVGPGGAGKTRLLLEAASLQRERVWFVPLATVSEPERLAEAVLSSLGPSGNMFNGAKPQQVTPVDKIVELLDVGDAVLLLDNCEHLVEAAAELAEQLLVRLPQLKILATSREPLAIIGEALCHLGPLELPPSDLDPDPDLAEVARTGAVRLFVDRAASVRPGFALDHDTIGAVMRICRGLDGMPLALELAAAKLRQMSAAEIARRLDDRFRLLTSGSRTALPRQRTLLAMVEWSWDLLEEPERILARRLSAFPGGAGLAALEAVCTDESLPAEDALGVAGALVEKSLVQEHEGRYRMLETVRAYATARLTESGDDIAGRLSGYFLAFAEEREPLLRTRDQLRAIADFDAEYDNLVYALRTAIAARDALTASRFVRALFWYWGIKGLSSQFETFLTEVLAFGDELPADTLSAFQVVRGVAAEAHTPSRPVALGERALSFHPAVPLFKLSRLASADQSRAELEHALNSSDPWTRASALWAQDYISTQQGDMANSAQRQRVALRAFEEVGDRWGMVMCLLAISVAEDMRGRYPQAIAAAERAVVISSELGTEEHVYASKNRLASARARSGDLAGGLRDVEAAHDQARRRGHRHVEARLLNARAAVLRWSGSYEPAHQALDELEGLAHRLPMPTEIVHDLIAGGRVSLLIAEGDSARARELFPQALRGVFAFESASHTATAAEWLGRLLALEGDAEGAATVLGSSQVIRGLFDHGDPALRAVLATLIEQLGEDGFHEAFNRGAEMPRQDAIDRLAGQAGRPVAG
ncbi:BTAD domain-containing putative transcriptional regulator [Nonomuraea antri]|uniref:BTAD domain-containing putative transcriptional regulator n=1 Tax=Nonomuraea antri TaxID=2730852 RepID=UPI001C2C2785|nr:BTAD domain-containing putative transcriptional regulator [Nonomuraea antri]